MPDEVKDSKTGEETPEEKRLTKFKGASGTEFEIEETLYNDIVKKFSGERSALQSKYEKEAEELKAKFADTEKQLNEIRKASMSEKERAEAEKLEKENAYLDAQSKAEKNYQMYQDYRIKTDIEKVINKYSDKLVAPQFMGLIIENKLKPVLKDDKILVGDSDLEQAFIEFLGKEEAKSLLKNTLPPGSGSPIHSKTPSNQKLEYKRSDLQNETIRKEYNERRRNGEEVKIIE